MTDANAVLRWILRRIGRWVLGMAVGLLPLVLVVGLSVVGWLVYLWDSTGQTDAAVSAFFDEDWLPRAKAAAQATVDPNRPAEHPFRLTVEAVASLRLAAMDVPAAALPPERLVALLRPQFTYQRLPVHETERWTVCDPDRTGATVTGSLPADVIRPEVPPCTIQEDTRHGEVEVLQVTHTFEAVTTFHYRQEQRTFPRGDREVTETYWVLDTQERQIDDRRLRAAIATLGWDGPEQRAAWFYEALASTRTDPFLVDVGGGALPTVGVYDGPLPGGTWLWPTPGATQITDRFGPRIHPIFGTQNFHTGLDIGAAHGQGVVAAASGLVTYAVVGYNGGYGNRVEVSHPDGVITTYNHLSLIDVAPGHPVRAGEIIGRVGSTGNSTGPHLHFEVIINGGVLDPLRLIGR